MYYLEEVGRGREYLGEIGQSRGGLFKSKGGGGSMYYLEEVGQGRVFLGEINTSGLVVVCFRVKVEEQQV